MNPILSRIMALYFVGEITDAHGCLFRKLINIRRVWNRHQPLVTDAVTNIYARSHLAKYFGGRPLTISEVSQNHHGYVLGPREAAWRKDLRQRTNNHGRCPQLSSSVADPRTTYCAGSAKPKVVKGVGRGSLTPGDPELHVLGLALYELVGLRSIGSYTGFSVRELTIRTAGPLPGTLAAYVVRQYLVRAVLRSSNVIECT